MPSARQSATAHVGPIGACFSYGYSYEAETFVAAFANAASALPWLTPGATGVVVQSALRSSENTLPLPGRPFHSVHFVLGPSTAAAWITSYSTGASTATRFPF